MGLQITASLSTNYSMCVGAAPKPLEARETLSIHFTAFSLGSSPTAAFVKNLKTGESYFEVKLAR